MLEWAEYGDPDGFPVLVQPGTPGTAEVGALLHAGARRARVRLVAVSRPGYGASATTAPGLASVAHQCARLADELGQERFGVWGLSGGGPYALAQAAETPDRVTRVVVSAGPADGGPTEGEASLTAEAEGMRAHFAGLDDEALAAAAEALAPPNEHYFADHPDDRPTFFADLRRAVARPDGYVRDNLSWGGVWDVSLAGLGLPVDLVYGESDLMVPLDNGRRLAAAIPRARLHVLPGAGHGEATFGSADLALGLLGGRESGL